MKTITIELPESAFSSLKKSVEEMAIEMKYSAVAKWYELGLISQSKGAEICEMSRHEFLRLLSKYKVSVLQYTEEQLENELNLFLKK